MSLLALRTAIVNGLAAQLGASVRSVEAIAGRIDDAELKRMLANAPAAFVAVLGVPEADRNRSGQYELTATVVVFLATASRPGSPRDAAALTLATALLQIVPTNAWGLADANEPQGIRAENLYSTALDKQGLALWAVTWRQEICVGGLDPATLVDFKTFHADWAVGATPDTPEPADELTGLDQ